MCAEAACAPRSRFGRCRAASGSSGRSRSTLRRWRRSSWPARARCAGRSCSTCAGGRGRRRRWKSATSSGAMAPSRLVRFDDEFRARWGDLLAGIDEAGRGPLAGPVVAASVILKPGSKLRGVRDSKELTPREREEAARRVRAAAAAVGVGVAGVAEVDAFNIRMASLLAMRRAVEALGLKPQGLIVDGRDLV